MKKHILLLHALLPLTLVPAVDAQPESAYYGVSIGEFAYSDLAFGQTFNDSVGSWRLMLGYQLLEHFALEGSYGETSTVRDTASGSLPGSPELGIETEIDNFLTFRVLGTLPFDNGLSLMAGFGFFVFEQDIILSVNGVPDLSGEVGNDRGRPAYYVGAQYDWDRVALRLGYEKFDFDGAASAEEVALSFFYKL
jgi:hypothetical protein